MYMKILTKGMGRRLNSKQRDTELQQTRDRKIINVTCIIAFHTHTVSNERAISELSMVYNCNLNIRLLQIYI